MNHEEELDWLGLSGDLQMHFETIEIASFTGYIAAMLFTRQQLAAFDADIAARWNGQRIHHLVWANT